MTLDDIDLEYAHRKPGMGLGRTPGTIHFDLLGFSFDAIIVLDKAKHGRSSNTLALT